MDERLNRIIEWIIFFGDMTMRLILIVAALYTTVLLDVTMNLAGKTLMIIGSFGFMSQPIINYIKNRDHTIMQQTIIEKIEREQKNEGKTNRTKQ